LLLGFAVSTLVSCRKTGERSLYGPAVRCKGKRELESTVLHQIVSGLVLKLMLRTIMEIRARPSSLAAMPPRAMWVISSQMRWKDHFSIACFLSQTSVGKRIVALTVVTARRYARPPRSRSGLAQSRQIAQQVPHPHLGGCLTRLQNGTDQ
jgi:hypothetical protein